MPVTPSTPQMVRRCRLGNILNSDEASGTKRASPRRRAQGRFPGRRKRAPRRRCACCQRLLRPAGRPAPPPGDPHRPGHHPLGPRITGKTFNGTDLRRAGCGNSHVRFGGRAEKNGPAERPAPRLGSTHPHRRDPRRRQRRPPPSRDAPPRPRLRRSGDPLSTPRRRPRRSYRRLPRPHWPLRPRSSCRRSAQAGLLICGASPPGSAAMRYPLPIKPRRKPVPVRHVRVLRCLSATGGAQAPIRGRSATGCAGPRCEQRWKAGDER